VTNNIAAWEPPERLEFIGTFNTDQKSPNGLEKKLIRMNLLLVREQDLFIAPSSSSSSKCIDSDALADSELANVNINVSQYFFNNPVDIINVPCLTSNGAILFEVRKTILALAL
jgi:hypothetical protein